MLVDEVSGRHVPCDHLRGDPRSGRGTAWLSRSLTLNSYLSSAIFLLLLILMLIVVVVVVVVFFCCCRYCC